MASTDTHCGREPASRPAPADASRSTPARSRSQTAAEEEGARNRLHEAGAETPSPAQRLRLPGGPRANGLHGETSACRWEFASAQGHRRVCLGGRGPPGLSTQSASLSFVLSSVGTFFLRKLDSSLDLFVPCAHLARLPNYNVSVHLEARPDHSIPLHRRPHCRRLFSSGKGSAQVSFGNVVLWDGHDREGPRELQLPSCRAL